MYDTSGYYKNEIPGQRLRVMARVHVLIDVSVADPHLQSCIAKRRSKRTRACFFIHASVCVFLIFYLTHIYIYIYIYVCTYMCVYVYTHTQRSPQVLESRPDALYTFQGLVSRAGLRLQACHKSPAQPPMYPKGPIRT